MGGLSEVPWLQTESKRTAGDVLRIKGALPRGKDVISVCLPGSSSVKAYLVQANDFKSSQPPARKEHQAKILALWVPVICCSPFLGWRSDPPQLILLFWKQPPPPTTVGPTYQSLGLST